MCKNDKINNTSRKEKENKPLTKEDLDDFIFKGETSKPHSDR